MQDVTQYDTPASEPPAFLRLTLARFGVVGLLAMAAVIAYLTRHCLAVANTTMQVELGINNEQFGYLYGAFSLGYLLFQVPGGWLGQRWGTRSMLPWLAIVWSLMTIATARVGTLPALILARFGFGLAQAGLVPNQAQVLRDWIPGRQRGLVTGTMVVAMSVGSVASLALTSYLMEQVPWRGIFHVYGMIGLIWAGLFWVAFRTTPAEFPSLQRSVTWEAGQVRDRCEKKLDEASEQITFGALVGSAAMWGLGTQACFKAAGYNLLVTFLPTMLELGYGVSKSHAGAMASWSLLMVIIGSMLGGWFVDQIQVWTNSKFYSRSGFASLSLGVTALLMLLASFSETAAGLSVWIAAASLISGLANAGPWAATLDLGGKNTAVVMGVMNMASALAGLLFVPLVGRLIDDRVKGGGDWNTIILLHALFYLLAALGWLVVNPDQPLNRPNR
jgi:ACS family glucarate transporter-like MFS transporter